MADFEYSTCSLTAEEVQAAIVRVRRSEYFAPEPSPYCFATFALKELPPSDAFPIVRTDGQGPPLGAVRGLAISHRGSLAASDLRHLLEGFRRGLEEVEPIDESRFPADDLGPLYSDLGPLHRGVNVFLYLAEQNAASKGYEPYDFNLAVLSGGMRPLEPNPPSVSLAFERESAEWDDPSLRKDRFHAFLGLFGLDTSLRVILREGDLTIEEIGPEVHALPSSNREEVQAALARGETVYTPPRMVSGTTSTRLQLRGSRLDDEFERRIAACPEALNRVVVSYRFSFPYECYGRARQLLTSVAQGPWRVNVQGSTQYTFGDFDVLAREAEAFNLGAFRLYFPSGGWIRADLSCIAEEEQLSADEEGYWFGFEFFDAVEGSRHDEMMSALAEIFGGREWIR